MNALGELELKHLVMHGLAVKKFADAGAVADALDLDPETTRAVLTAAVAGGRIAEHDSRYSLTPTGRMILESRYDITFENARADTAFEDAWKQFELINDQLKALVTDWQTTEVGGERVTNDHADADYDAEVIDRLGDVHERVEPVIDRLAAVVPRLAVYKRKLGAALDRVDDGDSAWFSDARIESYHTVWFELHEDLLRMLGRTRRE